MKLSYNLIVIAIALTPLASFSYVQSYNPYEALLKREVAEWVAEDVMNDLANLNELYQQQPY